MGNRLFQEARTAVELAQSAQSSEKQTAILRAKNALSSAYANSTVAEQAQLSQMQSELDQLE
ncbi:DUF3813 domain-containing protein [Pseudoneobacillus rhizosphaerae]|jgi:hypothetical protein|uniref:DUF3813 domain-containing protein n=1 Tax=Pseudoneobacillus rhizosphaerae TaxID=2880968 RepID=A0A9C7GBK6_9BACI|nr:DUF3813 domain-containing protein [Pseudoneobacillus rhizosphaerae]CAG9609203.1 hypothetical protein NEOCIP111885_02945 [Pseudoneobacillus rhizosphaerae]